MVKVQLRSDLDEKTSEMLLFIKKWLNTNYNTEAVKFCIKQTYEALKDSGTTVIRRE